MMNYHYNKAVQKLFYMRDQYFRGTGAFHLLASPEYFRQQQYLRYRQREYNKHRAYIRARYNKRVLPPL